MSKFMSRFGADNLWECAEGHSSVVIGDQVYVWGGHKKLLPLVHDSSAKRKLISSVECFDLFTSKWEKQSTTGVPHNGTVNYSSSSIGDDIYYFGGSCKPSDCYHNNLFVLNTNTNGWREVMCSGNGPMRKAHCGMTSCHLSGEDYLLIAGGMGPIPANAPTRSFYSPYSVNPSLCLTNELHLLCVSSLRGEWTVPARTGCLFPPCSGFTINTLQGDKAILFGGLATDYQGQEQWTNDVFIISLTKSSVEFQRLLKPSDSIVEWPKERVSHSSTIVTSVSSELRKKSHLIVMGGLDENGDVISDCWVMDIESKHWKQIILPDSATMRKCHSLTGFQVSVNCAWLLVTGGLTTESVLVTGPNTVMMVELEFSNDQWSVSNVMNNEDMKKKDQYSKLLFNRLSEGRRQSLQIVEEAFSKESSAEETYEEIDIFQPPKEYLSGVQLDMEKLQLQHEKELENLQKRLEQEWQERAEQEKMIMQKKHEIRRLKDRLEECSWLVERNEVELTNIKLGDGAYGEVMIAIFRGTRVAAKCLHQLIVSDYNRGLFTREMEVSSRIHHPNIVQFIGATRVNNPILLYELMCTSLYSRLQEGQRMTHPQIINVCLDIASALCYLHLWKPDPIIHRDVSSPNVLMEPLANGRWRSKLSDFGSANLQLRVKTIVPGNPAYASPESLNPQHHSPAMDIYSFGVLAIEMMLHCPPEMECLKRQEQAHSIEWTPMKILVMKCISSDCVERPTALQLLDELKLVKQLN